MYSTATISTHYSFPWSAAGLHSSQAANTTRSQLPKLSRYYFGNALATPVKGPPTPPADEMGTAYQAPAYESHGVSLPAYHPALAQVGRPRPISRDSQGSTDYHPRHHPQPQVQRQQPQPQVQPRHTLISNPSSAAAYSGVRHATRPSTPLSHTSQKSEISNGDPQAMVLHSLEIPAPISPQGGNFADFSALLTCLFWFEPTNVLDAPEKHSAPPATAPTIAFKKWVHTVLSTTQVTQNVVLLALMYIYRLKLVNKAVRGRSGSEYRLLTIALMLANKFLDDNTYTNKTWAEVSGISVQEIHVMEVEMLSNMRYNLAVSQEQWLKWIKRLAAFWQYNERARTSSIQPDLSPANIPSSSAYSPLPSPATARQPIFQSAHLQPDPRLIYSPDGSALYHDNPTSSVWPTSSPPGSSNDRKRSLMHEELTPSSKRVKSTTALHPSNTPTARLPRLQVPSQTANPPKLSLPPLGAPAMSLVYPLPTTTWAPQLPVLITSGPALTSTPEKRLSPLSALAPVANYNSSSPLSYSPSAYLERASPYRPVRSVDRLLCPQPSSLQNYHLAGAPPETLHYQPVGQRNNIRQGVLPEFQYTERQQQYPRY